MILEQYLNKIQTDMDDLLSSYKVVVYSSKEDIEKGLLRFNKPPFGYAFLFKFPDEKIRSFHTIGMKFPIIIHFFNKDKGIVFTDKVNPGLKNISSKNPAKYVVEIPYKRKE